MEITNQMIKQLREKTGAGMMDCKRALEATGGDLERAVEHLRKKGAAVAQKRADRSAKEGLIVTRVSKDARSGVIVEVNCETDFVGRSEDFALFARIVAETIERNSQAQLADVPGLTTEEGKKLAELLNDLLAKVGEKVEVRRFARIESKDGVISSYTHLGSKIGVLVELTGVAPESASGGVGRDVAMQIAAMNPMVISREHLDKNLIERELEIYRSQAKNEGKPPQIVEKIAMGRLEKFYQEVCLLEQTFIKDSGKTVKDYVHDAATKNAGPVSVTKFHRFQLGEESN
jgi:elongation factor Ts